MEISDLKHLFESFCKKGCQTNGKKLFGMEYENFILVPKNNSKVDFVRSLYTS